MASAIEMTSQHYCEFEALFASLRFSMEIVRWLLVKLKFNKCFNGAIVRRLCII